ncbi:hypothetical protein F2Q70_00021774 [Brassica cretica]|uniref:Uncharacterized protein n=1 Tax=Brassica cretica TaxID=69181 RepID=A0A8S9GN76_BRACR|nr:hypothetical protein F2Q70_00021774 [Brassica cretica]
MPPASSFVKVIEQFWPSRGGDHVGQFALDSAFRWLVSLRGFFSGWISVRFWRAIRIEDEILDASYFRELSSE